MMIQNYKFLKIKEHPSLIYTEKHPFALLNFKDSEFST